MTHQMPIDIRNWLNARGLPNWILTKFYITYSPLRNRIAIPITDANGKVLFHKYRKNPNDISDSAKYTYEKGSHIALYGIENLSLFNNIIICEGEFDRLILESLGFHAVTSTGGAGSFQKEWIPLFKDKEVYVVFDNDEAGNKGVERVCKMIPHAKNIPLPGAVGTHGDVTDFFIKLGKTKEDFEFLMYNVAFVPEFPKEEVAPKKPRASNKKFSGVISFDEARKVPIGNYLKLNSDNFALCPWHNEKTPSLKVFPDNKFKCFGCGVHGDVIDIVERTLGLGSPLNAVKHILNKNG